MESAAEEDHTEHTKEERTEREPAEKKKKAGWLRSMFEFRARFERKIKLSKAAGLVERTWDRLLIPSGLAMAFGIAVASGAWQQYVTSVSARTTGLLLLAGLMAVALKPLLSVRKPTRAEALERMNRATGAPGRPASLYDDVPATGTGESGRALWEYERDKIERDVKFRAGWPRSSWAERDPLALRFALPVILALTASYAHYEGALQERAMAAFDVTPGLQARTAKIDAWVEPPAYTGDPVVYIASTREDKPVKLGKSIFSVPEGSILKVRLHDTELEPAATGGTTSVEESCEKTKDGATECQFELASDAEISVAGYSTGRLVWDFNITQDKPPEIGVAPAPQPEDGIDDPESESVTYSLKDEYPGARVTGGRVLMPEKAKEPGPEARPLPLYGKELRVIR